MQPIRQISISPPTSRAAHANWSNPGNWTPNVPVSSTATSIAFGNSSSQLTTNQDIAEPFDLNSLTITGFTGSYVINGGTLRFGANGTTAPRIEIANGASGNTINSPVSFNASGTIALTGNAGQIQHLTVASLTVGQGTLSLTSTNVNFGELFIGDLTLGNGVATAAPVLAAPSVAVLPPILPTAASLITYKPNPGLTPAGVINGLIMLEPGAHIVTGTNRGSDFYGLVLTAR